MIILIIDIWGYEMVEKRKSTPKKAPVKKTKVQEVAEMVTPRKIEKSKKLEASRLYFPTGSTLLNCACSDLVDGGIPIGKVVNFVGDSGVGKTLIAETLLAEVANHANFDDYILILDDAEHALEMDMVALFGKKAAARIKAPRYDSAGMPLNSETIEQFFANIMSLCKSGQKFIYILDSLDSLSDASEYEDADNLATLADKSGDNQDNVKLAGNYGVKKARLMSHILRVITSKVAKNNSFVGIISQVRDNISTMPMGPTKRRAGGRALQFYCTYVIWLIKKKTLKINKDIIGAAVDVEIKKNKVTGKERTIAFEIRYSYGIDDTASMLDFLLDYSDLSRIKAAGAYIDASVLGYDKKVFRKDLIIMLEDDNKIKELQNLVQQVWTEKEQALLDPSRKKRFGE